MIGIYVHTPFCETRCPYCDFVSRTAAPTREFVAALRAEIRAFEGPRDAGTVFFGGGTPSLLDLDSLSVILEAVHARFAVSESEITIEANPDDVTAALARGWKDLGITRVSLGVQSFDDRVLRYLGRRHDAAGARRACAIISSEFENWGMDLIFGARPIDAWDATLETCLEFAPKHVAAYGLTYEEGTPFGDRKAEAVDDETWLALYRRARERLAAFDHYEISNYARPGYACRHNLIYWRNEAYAGFGPAAYSFLDGVRSRNATSLEEYLAAPARKSESVRISPREQRVETVIQHLRLAAGLPKRAYEARFGNDVHVDFGPPLESLAARGLILEDADSIRPTPAGFELNNEIGLALVG